MKSFASDNYSGVHPHLMEALTKANEGHVTSYGGDPYTAQAIAQFRALLGDTVAVYFTFIGTAANVLGLKALTQPHHAIICADTAHIQVDECGAPERFTSCKLLTVPTADGKLRPEDLTPFLDMLGFEHHVQPKVISISQSTELGTLYRQEEIRALADFAHQHKAYLHMDGARIANAAAALGKSIRSFTFDCGVDVLSFGGTKNGLMYGEAIVFANEGLCEDFQYTRKQGMQLASKMRYISAQFSAYLQDDFYLQPAHHANAMAALLAEKLQGIPEVKITQKVEVNAVFARIPAHCIPALQKEYFFYEWDSQQQEVRWMCSWDTTPADIDAFVATLQKILAH